MTHEIDFTHHGHPVALWNVLESIAKCRKIDAYLEVGVCWGKSLSVVLSQQYPTRITLCDTWGSEYGGEAFGGPTHIEIMLAKMRFPHPVTFLNGDSHILLKDVKETFDLILVDGDHSPVGARMDLEDCWALLQPHGLLVFDDLTHPSHPELMEVFSSFVWEMRRNARIVHEDFSPMGVGVLCKTSS